MRHAHERSRAVAQEEMKVKDSRVPKIVSACFASGATTLLTLLIAAPSLGILWAVLISVLVGGSVGYFGYQFREVLRAIPKAARASIPLVVLVCTKIHEFFSKPRPFLFADLLVSVILSIASATMSDQLTTFEFVTVLSGMTFIFFMLIAMSQILLIPQLLDLRNSTEEKWCSRAKVSPGINEILNAKFPPEVLLASISWRDMFELH